VSQRPGSDTAGGTPEESAAADSPAVATTRTVDIVVQLVLLALALLLAYDNYRTGMGWDATGPQAGYFPFYLSMLLAGACVFGVAKEFVSRAHAGEAFVRRDQFKRVIQVFVPTLAFCLLTQWLGIYIASFLLVAGFMKFIGRIAVWKALLTAVLFSLAMFVTLEIAFDVIMPKGPVEAFFGR
jgi:putative tricarboxylic transport membrane protein